jgi:S1-C subfamily serine protease
MYIKTIVFFSLLTLIGCSENNKENNKKNQIVIVKNTTEHNSAIIEDKPQYSSQFINNFTKKVSELISKNEFVSFSRLQQQKLKNIEENSKVKVSSTKPKKMSGNELYFYLKERNLVVGAAYKGQFENIYLSLASAYVISKDGTIATNYHVINVRKNMSIITIFVSDKDGNVYPVTEVLSSSQANDMAILKIDTKGKKLKALPFAKEELMGEDIYMMGHPFNNTYFMSKGIIARKYISERDMEARIGVTVDYGQGASGGSIVNRNGQLVAMASSTYLERINGSGPVQMVIKEAIPVSTLWNYVEQK